LPMRGATGNLAVVPLRQHTAGRADVPRRSRKRRARGVRWGMV
jgi:hypothetical protein